MRAFLRSRIAEDAADAYLAALMEKIGVIVFDHRFELPTAREVFL
jgi:predicted nucleic acid-binding protein